MLTRPEPTRPRSRPTPTRPRSRPDHTRPRARPEPTIEVEAGRGRQFWPSSRPRLRKKNWRFFRFRHGLAARQSLSSCSSSRCHFSSAIILSSTDSIAPRKSAVPICSWLGKSFEPLCFSMTRFHALDMNFNDVMWGGYYPHSLPSFVVLWRATRPANLTHSYKFWSSYLDKWRLWRAFRTLGVCADVVRLGNHCSMSDSAL
jgi:hypothetical protein